MFESKEYILLVQRKNIYVKHLKQPFENSKTLVLLHDSLGCVMLWRDWPELLAEALHCDVLVYDRVGYGQSDKMDTTIRGLDYLKEEAVFLDCILQELAIEKVALFGHSDGASIALWYSSLYPNKTIATVSEAAHVMVEEVTLQGVRDAKLAYETTDLGERLVRYHGDKVDDVVKAWITIWLDDSYRRWSMVDSLSTITSPLLFGQGTLDEYGTLAQVDTTLSNVSGIAEKCIFEGIGHTPHKEIKDQTMEIIECFFKRYL